MSCKNKTCQPPKASSVSLSNSLSLRETLETFLSESKALYNLTNYVDYDQDSYCKRGESMFSQLLDIAIQCRDMMAEYRAKLAKEEMLSCSFNSPNGKR